MSVKTIITRKGDDVITNIVTSTEVVPNGLQVADPIMGTYIIAGIDDYNVYTDLETVDTIVPEQYTYTITNGFVKNANYKPYVSIEDQLVMVQQQNAQMILALVQGGLM